MSKEFVNAPPAKMLFSDAQSPRELSEMQDEFVAEMTKSTIGGLVGETYIAGANGINQGAGAIDYSIGHRQEQKASLAKACADVEMAKSAVSDMSRTLTGARSELLSKEWTLSNPIGTGLVPFDLEAPAKLLTPRPTPLRNSIPRLRGQGGQRRFKVISGFTGTGTGGATTVQPGINESTTNTGPGGLAYVRPPYINYDGYDVTLSYVSWGLSDSVSWQSEYQGQGFEDIRTLSNTALLYSTMLLDERLMLYGRGISGNGYAGALGTPGSVTLTAVNASVAPGGSSSLTAGTSWVVLAADAGDILGTNGTSMHQGPATTAASVAVTAGQAIQYTIGTDVTGAVGYNAYVGSVSTGPFYYAGRTGYNTGYITSQPTSGPNTTSGATDQSAVSTNFDGLITNLAASGGYTKRLNSTFSTSNPGVEFQNAFASLYESVKSDPDEIWLNGFDRKQLSDAVLSGANVNAYRVFIQDPQANAGAKIGALVQGIVNEVTGKEIPFNVHPWMPAGNAIVRSVTLPIPDSNVSETSVMVLPQDYVAVQWPTVQFTYDASTFEIGTMCHYAPQWSGLIQGIQSTGIGNIPPSYGDS